jgi:sulfoxide reductase catalytic subunit YedY
MLTRRNLIRTFLLPVLLSFSSALGLLLKLTRTTWAEVKKILPKGFSRKRLKEMNPAEIDNRNLEIDPLNQFGTMGPTEVAVDRNSYRLKVSGQVARPLSLSYDQILKYPSLTETVLLICPGFFSNNGRWTGINLRSLFQEAEVKKEATYFDIKGAHEKVVRITLQEIDKKRIFLAYRVNGETLPQKHGFPLRLVYEDAYGYDWIKYVDEIVVY